MYLHISCCSVYFKTILNENEQLSRHYRRGKSFPQLLLFSSFPHSLFLDNKVSWFTHHVWGNASLWRSSELDRLLRDSQAKSFTPAAWRHECASSTHRGNASEIFVEQMWPAFLFPHYQTTVWHICRCDSSAPQTNVRSPDGTFWSFYSERKWGTLS